MFGNFLGLVDQVLAYVEDVLSGKVPPNAAVGRALLDMIHSVPKMTPQEFDNMFTSNIKVCIEFLFILLIGIL